MKKVFASLLMVGMLAGTGAAHAEWFWQHDRNADTDYSRPHQTRAIAASSENKKSEYNGNNAYRSIAGQVAVEDRMNDGDDTAFVVHPTHGRLNASLRQGDTGQSMDTRMNHTFNN